MISTYCGDIIGLVKGDLIGAIVNPANHELAEGGTLCGEIYDHAGAADLKHDLHGVRGMSEGSAVITYGYHLSDWIIHTLAPRYDSEGKWESLKMCYQSILQMGAHLSGEAGVEAVAIPAIGTGAFGLDKDKADEIAYLTLSEAHEKPLGYDKVNFVLVFNEPHRYQQMLDKDGVADYTRRRMKKPTSTLP